MCRQGLIARRTSAPQRPIRQDKTNTPFGDLIGRSVSSVKVAVTDLVDLVARDLGDD